MPPVCSNCGASDFVWANELKTGSIGGGTLSLRSRGELAMGTRICKACGHADLFLKDPSILRQPHTWRPGEFVPIPSSSAHSGHHSTPASAPAAPPVPMPAPSNPAPPMTPSPPIVAPPPPPPPPPDPAGAPPADDPGTSEAAARKSTRRRPKSKGASGGN
ncbi:MAG TPA: hypothetical protein VMC82_01175 [Thermoplasmata archaeon]|nr:hypothetical protein [Thermoplasmata archaeon]